jgi:trehalose/maltose transport system substrate-binding protein
MGRFTAHPGVERSLSTWAAVVLSSAAVLLGMTFAGCRRTAREPVTLTYFRLGWSQPDELPTAEPLALRFTQKTGIRLKSLPVPETTLDQLELSRKLLRSDSGPDVLGVDLIWSAVLADDLIDLRPYLADEMSALEPNLLPSYTVDGKVLAIPYSVQVGVLEYRSDLLREYGYDHPPRTWDELESMSMRIQTGERAKGKKDFWGYVWQGAQTEALACNALEWQYSAGGGQIIENNRTISVNNSDAIRSWQRAKRWIGSISPPTVVAYQELDTINVFDTGRAAFNRVWGGTPVTPSGFSRQLHGRTSLAEGRTGYSSMPAGNRAWVGTLGGSGLAVSRHSAHPMEAIELVRFLVHEGIQTSEEEVRASASTPQVYGRPSVSEPRDPGKSNQSRSSVVSRPSSITGNKYEQVTKAYVAAVHSVLTGQREAPAAAADLEKQLIAITGFSVSSPRAAN